VVGSIPVPLFIQVKLKSGSFLVVYSPNNINFQAELLSLVIKAGIRIHRYLIIITMHSRKHSRQGEWSSYVRDASSYGLLGSTVCCRLPPQQMRTNIKACLCSKVHFLCSFLLSSSHFILLGGASPIQDSSWILTLSTYCVWVAQSITHRRKSLRWKRKCLDKICPWVNKARVQRTLNKLSLAECKPHAIIPSSKVFATLSRPTRPAG
jgi:hypothetical protein